MKMSDDPDQINPQILSAVSCGKSIPSRHFTKINLQLWITLLMERIPPLGWMDGWKLTLCYHPYR